MTDSTFKRQSSTSPINTPIKDDVFDFSNFYSDAERTNTPYLMMDQSSYGFNPKTSIVSENSPDFSSGILLHDFNGNGQRNGYLNNNSY